MPLNNESLKAYPSGVEIQGNMEQNTPAKEQMGNPVIDAFKTIGVFLKMQSEKGNSAPMEHFTALLGTLGAGGAAVAGPEGEGEGEGEEEPAAERDMEPPPVNPLKTNRGPMNRSKQPVVLK